MERHDKPNGVLRSVNRERDPVRLDLTVSNTENPKTDNMKLYTVIAINRKTGREMPPRYDLRPMNHPAACNFMAKCRNEFTDYKIHEWPDTVPLNGEPLTADKYWKP